MYERYAELLKEKGLKSSDVTRNTGILSSTLSEWKQGKYTPKLDKLAKIANYLGVSVEWLAGTSDDKARPDDKACPDPADGTTSTTSDDTRKTETSVKIPILGSVPCGVPVEAIEVDCDEWEEIPERLAKAGTFFGLRAKGDSMSPSICENDILIVKQMPDVESGDIAIVRIDREDACCKRLIKTKSDIVLMSFNPAYEPMVFNSWDVMTRPVAIIGKVVEIRRKF